MANPLEGEVQVPALGGVSKKVLIPVVVGAGAFVAWRFYQARSSGGEDTGSTITDGEFGAVDSSIPGVVGAVKPDGDYGSGDTGGGDTSNSTPLTNSEWSQKAIAQLVSGNRSYDDVATAIGNYLGSQPLSTEQQAIVRSAIAVQGYPPVGTFSIISGGNTALTLAPGNVHLQSATPTSLVIAFNPVAGALGYRVYRDSIGANVGQSSGSPITVSGLQPNTSHQVAVRAYTSGSEGPKSAAVTAKTTSVSLAKPALPTVSSVTATTVKVSTGAVKGADGYRWYINGNLRGASEAPTYTITGLARNTKYNVSVSADVANQNPGPNSGARNFTTKK